MEIQEIRAARISDFKDKNLATYFDYSKGPSSHKKFIKRVISSVAHWGDPDVCPNNDHLFHMRAKQATVMSLTTYGGPASKYRDINEDSCFFGISESNSVVTGVIDGSGGSQHGYLGGKLANQTLSNELQRDATIACAFKYADANVILNARGGYATAAIVKIDSNLNVKMGCKGDSKALTLRNGKPLNQGTTKIQSVVARKIEQGELPAHAIHTGKKKNIIYSMIGDHDLPLYETEFQGKPGDLIVIASDGLWDVATDYEVNEMSKIFTGVTLEWALYELAYLRNNSKQPYFIQFSKDQHHLMHPLFKNGRKCRGDNITVQVVELI